MKRLLLFIGSIVIVLSLAVIIITNNTAKQNKIFEKDNIQFLSTGPELDTIDEDWLLLSPDFFPDGSVAGQHYYCALVYIVNNCDYTIGAYWEKVVTQKYKGITWVYETPPYFMNVQPGKRYYNPIALYYFYPENMSDEEAYKIIMSTDWNIPLEIYNEQTKKKLADDIWQINFSEVKAPENGPLDEFSDNEKEYMICNRSDANPCIAEFYFSDDFPVITENVKEITLDDYEKIAFFCITSYNEPLYVVNKDDKYFLILDGKEIALDMCPSDMLPFADSAILIFDDAKTLTSSVYKINISNGTLEKIISDLAFERTEDAIKTCTFEIIYKSKKSKSNEWSLYDGETGKTSTLVIEGAFIGFLYDSSQLIFCDFTDSDLKNNIKITKYDTYTNESEILCNFTLDDKLVNSHEFILLPHGIERNYAIIKSKGDNNSDAMPKSYIINIDTGKYAETDFMFNDSYSYIVLS